ncbi:MBL fold metallo-hydrolase [Bacillus sp. AK128]
MLFILFLLILMVGTILFLNHPTFGGKISKEDRQTYHRFKNYRNGKFINQAPTDMKMSVHTIMSLMKDSMIGKKKRKPSKIIPISPINWEQVMLDEDSITWFGHSSFLISIDSKKILIDPMFGPSPSPLSIVGSKRYSQDLLPIIDELPFIDAVLITHDHYDHLDYPSILKLKEKVKHFFVPYGVGAHLLRWGVTSDKFTEMNWWDEHSFEGLTIAAVPSQHFSGRGMLNRESTLWTGWVILGNGSRLYTSGDGGYGEHFKQIGEKYGPFDLTLIEGGQYDHRWSSIHMVPEDSVQAHLDVKGKKMFLSHWGAFTLAFHGWKDPIERACIKATIEDVELITPKIGETVLLNEKESVSSGWWREFV